MVTYFLSGPRAVSGANLLGDAHTTRACVLANPVGKMVELPSGVFL